VHHGIDKDQWRKEYEKEVIDKILGKYDLLNCEFLMHVGAIQPRKDIKTIIDSFNIVKEKNKILKLVLVGGDGWMSEDIHAYAEKCKYSNDILFTGNIDFEEVKVLMQNASVFVFASKYEGFGLPVLEACAVGLPVVSTKNSSIPEILGENALYFNAGDSVQCAESINEIFSNEDLRERLRKGADGRVDKFSWDNCTRRTLQVLRK
jgi:glycosyltransferase involved in cell wall biosynthesis